MRVCGAVRATWFSADCCACGSGLGTLRMRTVKCWCAARAVIRGAFLSPKSSQLQAATCTTIETTIADDPLREPCGGVANSVIVLEDLMITWSE